MLFASVVPNYAYAKNITPLNELSVESSVLTEGITVDGNYIPAGALSVTVNISNNTGFSSFLSKISIDGDYNLICNNNNEPLIKSGSAFSDVLVASSEKNDTIAIATSSFEDNDSDGEIVSFYLTAADYGDIDFCISDYSFSSTSDVSLQGIGTQFELDHLGGVYYCLGDVDFNGIIDGMDCSAVLYAIGQYNTYKQSHPGSPNHLSVSLADANLSAFFGSSATLCAKSADVDLSTYITNGGDAQVILNYYAYDSVGNLEEFFDRYDCEIGTVKYCYGSAS